MEFTHKYLCVFVVSLTTGYGFVAIVNYLENHDFCIKLLLLFSITPADTLAFTCSPFSALTPCGHHALLLRRSSHTKCHRPHFSHHTEHALCQCWPVITLTDLFSGPRLYFSVSSDPCILISTAGLGCGFGLGRY